MTPEYRQCDAESTGPFGLPESNKMQKKLLSVIKDEEKGPPRNDSLGLYMSSASMIFGFAT